MNIFSALESLIDEEIPKEVVYILTTSGFDSKIAIKTLKHNAISEIENFFNENLTEHSSGFIGTRYENMKPFKLAPGHVALILGLAEYVDRIGVENHVAADKFNYFSYVLKMILKSAENNHEREPKGRRYDECLSYFATYIYLLCGRACYETLCNNLPLPQPNSICKYLYSHFISSYSVKLHVFAFLFLVSHISQSKCQIIEGHLRTKELLNYLEKMQLEKIVWLCEDGTGINSKVEYHPSTNQLVGLVLPTNSTTGMPIPFTFMANSAEEIEKHSRERPSTLVYVILALPLKPNVPPFVLQLFGTDNKFTTDNVLQRWQHTIRDLQK